MIVKSVEKENGKAKLEIEIERDQFEAGLDRVYRRNRGRIMIPGFRKGKAPRRVIEGMYGAGVFYEEAVDDLFPEVYEKALNDNEIKAVGRPSLTNMQRSGDGGMVLTIETELYPEVKLGQYLGLEVPKAEASVKDEEIEAELQRLVERNARITTVERPAAEGDMVTLDFDGFVDGERFEGGKADNYALKLGSHQFIPGFEEALVGVSAGEERDVNVTFPEDYDPKLAGKDAVFHCKVHEVKESILPELDDEFAKDVSEFDTLDEFRADIRARFQKQRDEEIQNAFENAAVMAAAANMTCEVPACMIDEQIERQLQNMAYQLRASGMELEDYAKVMGGDLNGLRRNMRPAAENEVRANILLSQIVEEEKLEADGAEIEEEYQKLAEQYGMKLEELKAQLKEDTVRTNLQVRKAVARITESAKPVAPQPPKAEEEGKASRDAGEEE